MSSNIQRVDNAIAAGSLHANQAVKNLFLCLKRNLDNALMSKMAVGDSLGLGFYFKPKAQQAKTDKKDVRNQVRACLLLYLTVGGGTAGSTAFKAERTRLLALTGPQLDADMLAKQIAGPQVAPTTILTSSLGPGPNPDHVKHTFTFLCGSGNLLHVAHVATREFVKYLAFRVPNAPEVPIALYGRATDFPRVACAPWFPNAETSTPGAGWPMYLAPPNPTVMGPYQNILGGGVDNHSFGPRGLCIEAGAHKGMVSAALIECTLYAEQEYQYNASCNPTTWSRDGDARITLANSAVHANDAHWTAFPTHGQWVLERRIYQDPTTRYWMLESTKRGNQPSNAGTRYTNVSRLIDELGHPFAG